MAKRISSNSEIVADQLHSLAIHLLRRLRREDESSGLNAARLSALSVIVFAGPVTLGDLAQAEQVRPPTMTRIVKALEQLGLVTKTKNTEDARIIELSATAAGKRLLMQGRERRVRALAIQIAELTEKDRLVLGRAAEILGEVIRAV